MSEKKCPKCSSEMKILIDGESPEARAGDPIVTYYCMSCNKHYTLEFIKCTELQKENEALKKKITELEEEIEDLHNAISEMVERRS